jgi:hypothetical protein
MKQRESGKLPLLGGHQTYERRRTKFFDMEEEKPSGFFDVRYQRAGISPGRKSFPAGQKLQPGIPPVMMTISLPVPHRYDKLR